jgi:hypothetical protein
LRIIYKEQKLKNVIARLKKTIERREKGAKCSRCGQFIWVVGSFIFKKDGYYKCTTGESDDSNDWDIDEVCTKEEKIRQIKENKKRNYTNSKSTKK